MVDPVDVFPEAVGLKVKNFTPVIITGGGSRQHSYLTPFCTIGQSGSEPSVERKLCVVGNTEST